MPFVQIKVFKNVLSTEQKKEMIARVSEVVAEIESRPKSKDLLLPHVWCQIEEMEPENFGVGGNQMTPEVVEFLKNG